MVVLTINILDWIGPDPAGLITKAYCKYCKCTLIAHKKDLINHGKTKKHIDRKKFDVEAKLCKKINFNVNKTMEQKEAELKLSVFIAEHSSLNTIDHLSELLPQIDPKSQILSNLKIHRTKCSMILKNVVAPCMLNNLIQDIGDSLFSIVIDESTDVANDKILCTMIRYFSNQRRNIVTTFYRLILVSQCNAESLFNAVKDQLIVDNLCIDNLIGIGMDGANVMVGAHHSFATLLKAVVPDIIIVKCVCHSLHLCAEYACRELPKCLEFLVREIHSYFSHSPKRIVEYRELYLNLQDKTPKKVTKLAGTRWLAREKAITIILDQWDELYVFFKRASVEDRCFSAEKLVNIMDCPAYKAYMVFLKSILQVICKTNLLFQSDDVSSFKLFQDLSLLLKSMLKKIVVPDQLKKISDEQLINYDFEQYLMYTDSMYFGYEFDLIAKTLVPQDKENVKKGCKNFIIQFCKQLQKRLPDNLAILEQINIFSPEIATSQKKSNIINIVKSFNRFPIDICQQEWECISNKTWRETDNVVKFWADVYDDKDSAGNYRFRNVGRLALALLSLPISNATVERAFSVYNVIKSHIRNKLSLDIMQAIMMVRYYLSIDNITCVNFKPTEAMIKKFNVTMYDHKNQKHCDEINLIYEIMNDM